MSTIVHVGAIVEGGPPLKWAGATGDSDEKRQPFTFSVAHFLGRTWRRVSAAVAVLFVGLAVALFLFITLGRWTRESVHEIFTRRALGLQVNLQSQLDSFEVGLPRQPPKSSNASSSL
jgi:hypothetical protein